MMYATAKNNVYDNLLVVLIVSLISGYAGGLVFSLVHLVELACLPYFLACRKLFRKKVFSHLLLFAFLWLSFSVVSLAWTSDVHKGIVTVIMYLFRFLMCFELLAFSMKARRPLHSISKGWLLAVLMTSVVALWEILTDHHLSIARETDMNTLNMLAERAQASVLFYNPNTYSLFLVMAFPFLVYRLTSKEKLLPVVAILLSMFIVIKDASRGAMLSIGVMMIISLFFFLKKKKYRGYAILSLLLLVGLAALFGESLFSSFILRMETQGMQDGARFEIWAGAWSLFLKSRGLGVGVGGMTAVLGALNHYGIGYAHCMLLEAMVEGGILIALLILFFLIKLFKAAWSEPQKEVRLVLKLSMITYPIYFIINSEYLRPAFIWCFFMCVYLYARHQMLQTSRPSWPNQTASVTTEDHTENEDSSCC